MGVLRKLKKLTTPEVFAEMGDPHIGRQARFLIKINIVKSPVMRKIRSYQYHIARPELFDAVADKLRPFTFLKMDQFHFSVIMPVIVGIRNKFLCDAERMVRFFR